MLLHIVNGIEITVIYTDASGTERRIFRHGGQNEMKEKRTGETVKKRTDWNHLRSLNDHQIRSAIESNPEARPTDAEFWKKARVVIPKANTD